MENEFSYRFAQREDVPRILDFIRRLAEYRGKGYGKALLQKLAQIAVERGCGRLEWSCLDWNRPSIDFYLSLDAEPMTGWTVYRLSAETLRRMAEDGAEQDSAAFADMI